MNIFFATSSLKHNLILNIGNATFEDETEYMGKLLETYVASSFHDLDNKNHINYKIYYDDSNKKKVVGKMLTLLFKED